MDMLTGIALFAVVAVVLVAGFYVMKPGSKTGPVSSFVGKAGLRHRASELGRAPCIWDSDNSCPLLYSAAQIPL